MKIIDLAATVTYDPSKPAEAFGNPEMEHGLHDVGFHWFEQAYFPGLKPEQIPNGGMNAFDNLYINTHCGTHMDAPLHYNAKMNGDEDSWSIDEVPIDWFYGDGVVLDFSDKPGEFLVEPEHLQEALEKINYTLQPGNIVLIHTAAPNYAGTPEYASQGCGMSKAATLWLTKENGIHVVGTDSFGWDRPFIVMKKEWEETHDPGIVWQGHLAGVEKAYCHMEKMVNLDKLPPFGFKVACFPIKLQGCTAGWIRPVAIIEDERGK